MVWWDFRGGWGVVVQNKSMSLCLGVVSKSLALGICFTCPCKLFVLFGECRRDPLQGWRGLSLFCAGQELCDHSFSTKTKHQSCWKLWCEAQVRLQPSHIQVTASRLQNNLVCIKVPGQYNGRLKVQLYRCWSQPKRCYDLVPLLMVFSFSVPFHFYSYVCSASWRVVRRFITWLWLNNVRISAEWVNLILKLNI